MPLIELTTVINAPAERCFDLARSIDFHIQTPKHTQEKAIAGRTTGLIELNETVTWQARHFGIMQSLSSKITEYEYAVLFTDEMIKGAFTRIKHAHRFKTEDGKTIMTDHFSYEVPYGLIGRLFNFLVLHRYLKKLLSRRNQQLKQAAESEEWKRYLSLKNLY